MPSTKEERIKKILQTYYSRSDVQKAIYEFSQHREVVPSFMMESFGKRPDSFQYLNDIFELVKKGATSFHCSQEIWEDPLKISTEMNEKQMDELRTGWDLLLDIDSKYLDYSKILVEQIVKIFRFHGVKNFGIKFSGSKGFHIIVPWKAFPKQVGELKTSDMFPEWPRIITQYLIEKTRPGLIKGISETLKKEDYNFAQKYIRRGQGEPLKFFASGAMVMTDMETSGAKLITEVATSGANVKQRIKEEYEEISAKKDMSDYIKEVMPDLILVSPRHLFRAPYSLHEKTALASVVLTPEQVLTFQPKDADPLKAEVKDFLPVAEEGEATELLREALDWNKSKHPEETQEKRVFDFKPIKLENLSDKNFPPAIKKILQGLGDGRKRALFILINFFRSIGMEREELEQRIDEWNEKNEVAVKKGYIKSQLSWAYRNKVVLPPNYIKDYYKGIGVVPTEEEMRYKNPVNYVVKKTFQENFSKKKTRAKNKDNFKKKD